MSPDQILIVIEDLKNPLFLTTDTPPKIGDRIITANSESAIIQNEDQLAESVAHQDQVLIPFIPPVK